MCIPCAGADNPVPPKATSSCVFLGDFRGTFFVIVGGSERVIGFGSVIVDEGGKMSCFLPPSAIVKIEARDYEKQGESTDE